MLTQLRAAALALLILTLVTGVAYPLLVTGIAQAAFPRQARGSLLERGGHVVGSALLGQPFDDARYFWGRLSATTNADGAAFPYNAGSSLGSNLGPNNPALLDAVRARIEALRAADPDNAGAIPVDLVTSSGSGLDPDVSPAAALYQAGRVARARRLSADSVRKLITDHARAPTFGFLGEPRVNVLELNMALDALE